MNFISVLIFAVSFATGTANKANETVSETSLGSAISHVISNMTRPEVTIKSEPEDDYNKRIEMIGDVLGRTSNSSSKFLPEDAAALQTTIWKFESAFDYNIHGGEPSELGPSDGGKAICMGQIHRIPEWWSVDEWKQLAGRDEESTERCSEATLRILEYHAGRCGINAKNRPLKKSEALKLFNAYATGGCNKPIKGGSVDRANTFETNRKRISSKLQAE